MTDATTTTRTATGPVGRALIYLRVSSSQQADKDYDPEGFSIPAQREACKRKAEALDAIVVEEFVDRGESAKTANRPGLQALLARLEERRHRLMSIVPQGRPARPQPRRRRRRSR